jgi:hypothetical protein
VCNNFSAEDVLFSQNSKFRASFDITGDGLGDNRDLFALGSELIAGGAGASVLDAYDGLLLKRADLNSSGAADAGDVAELYSHFGAPSWLYDLNVDGAVDTADVTTMITQLFRTAPGDFDLNGLVDARDYVIARKFQGTTGAGYLQGDADLDGDVDGADLDAWQQHFGFVRAAFAPGGGAAPQAGVPEPGASILAALAFVICMRFERGRRLRRRFRPPMDRAIGLGEASHNLFSTAD